MAEREAGRTRWSTAAALMLGAALGVGCATAACAAEPAGAETVSAVRQCFSDTIRVAGFVWPRGDSYVSINVEGFRVAEVLVRENDSVVADQELIRLARVGDDNGRGLPPTATLKAPASGTVLKRDVRVGQLTKAGTDPMLRIMTDPGLDLMVEIPSLYVTRIKAGSPARILTEDGTEVRGSIRVAATDVDPATQFGRARIAVPSGTNLRLGAFARALLDTGQSCGVAVPRSAIMRQSDSTSVRVVRDGRSETRRVRLGLSSADTVEIREGVAEGELVVGNAGAVF